MREWLDSAGKVLWFRRIATVFFLFHILAISSHSYFPKTTKLAEWVRAPFAFYIELTSQTQDWNLFPTWELIRSYDPVLVLRTPNEAPREYRANLPGLAESSDGLSLRTFRYFSSVFDSKEPSSAVQSSYFDRVCDGLARRESTKVGYVSLRFDLVRIRKPKDILKGRQDTFPDSVKWGPHTCDFSGDS